MKEIWLGDCLELMKNIPDNSVDMVLTDPPYNSLGLAWDKKINLEVLWQQIKRIRKNNSPLLFFASQPFSSILGASNIKELKYSWIWKKSKPTDFLQAKKKPLKGFEEILVFYDKYPPYFPQGLVEVNRVVKNTGTKSRKGIKENGDKTVHRHITGGGQRWKIFSKMDELSSRNFGVSPRN